MHIKDVLAVIEFEDLRDYILDGTATAGWSGAG
jgi:hypothetical protein